MFHYWQCLSEMLKYIIQKLAALSSRFLIVDLRALYFFFIFPKYMKNFAIYNVRCFTRTCIGENKVAGFFCIMFYTVFSVL